jgi:beta-lactamase regulating signal transducer with metallopeptidase domain
MAAGLMRPKVVVSAGTLLLLDDAELAAGLDHERAHIRRGHRFVLLVGELCGTTARLLPGTRRAVAELAFHLERDADRWVLARRHDPLALASAICKAATSCVQTSAVLTPLGGGYVTARLEELTNADPPHRAYRRVAMRTLAAVMASLALALLAVLPTAAMAGLRQPDHGADMPHCRR